MPPKSSKKAAPSDKKASNKETKSKSPAKEGHTKSTGSTPKTVLEKIVAAIRGLRDPGKGSSRAAIAKYLESEYDYSNAVALKKAFQQGVSKGLLEQTGQSFRVKADPVIANEDDESIEIQDLVVGGKSDDQEVAELGDTVTVAYVGTLDNGYQFDKASTFTFLLGAGDVIKGWDIGLKGMKKGGKRKLVVPSKLGYGKRGCKPDIPGDATLNFVVTLKDLKKP